MNTQIATKWANKQYQWINKEEHEKFSALNKTQEEPMTENELAR